LAGGTTDYIALQERFPNQHESGESPAPLRLERPLPAFSPSRRPPGTGSSIAIGDVTIACERRGRGAPLLVLPGEDDLEPRAALLDELAERYEVIVLWPPGFGASSRPDWVSDMDDAAYLFLDVLDRLDLRDVTVLGFSIGGWIAAEMAIKNQARLAKLVLVDPYGIKPGSATDRDIADVFLLYPEEVEALKWRDPAKGRRDYPSLPEDELTIVARNRESFARLCWEPYMHDPKLLRRLHRIAVPTLFVWGANDGIVTPAYGEAYRAAVPGARLAIVPEAGHLPHIEQPEAFARVLRDFLEETTA
jgi:pimeloyl-ACP methyl ester carboxylesterase